ncbi:hypothetical protein LQV05_003180, partial [Cryptococcus neoformans]
HRGEEESSHTNPTAPAGLENAVSSTLGPSPGTLPSLLPSQECANERFLYLAHLPVRSKPLPNNLVTDFMDAAERCALAYIAQPSDSTLLAFLALPKVGLTQALAPEQPLRPSTFLQQFPHIPWPEQPPARRPPSNVRPDTTKQVIKLVENGRLGAAERVLEEDASVAELDQGVIDQLIAKHPKGPSCPFGNAVGPTPGKAPDIDTIQKALDSFKLDTAPGVSGWSVPLLKTAAKREPVKQFLQLLCAAIANNTAPGRSMLRTSRLIPLKKDDGSIRPIAVGELLYRLCAKALIISHFQPDFLLPFQLGVKSIGGVEPIVRLTERVLEGSAGAEFSFLASLDASNAFNRVDRAEMAAAVKTHAPTLWRTCKWAYGDSSDLVCGDKVLQSSQGVRQGDPFGPLFFSITLRPTLNALCQSLGPSTQALAYLDDIYLFSTDSQVLSKTTQFLADKQHIIKLNEKKCKLISFDEIRKDGFKMLGTMVGGKEKRAEFLEGRIRREMAKVGKLKDLPHQHALLLLRFCIQQNLRHLQRSLRSDDLVDLWERLDTMLWEEVKRMRMRQREDTAEEEALGRSLTKLPARLGGLAEASDTLLDNLGLLSSPEEPPTPVPQRIRCAELWESQQEAILHNLGDTERKRLTENASRLGRSWLSVIPYLQPLRLSNVEIASGLHDRTLVGSSIPVCRFCGSDSPLGHDELCRARNPWTQRRHNAINRVIFQHLKQIQGATVEIEPHMLSGQRRNDLRVRGSGALAFADYDLKVYSLGDRDARSTVVPCTPNSKLAEFCLDRCVNWLDKVGQVVAKNAPKVTGGVFKPIILSTGGLVSKSTADEWKDWREAMPAGAFERMEKRIAPLAYKAAAAQADKHLANIFALDLPDKAPTPSQRELCSSMWEHQQTTILEGLNDPGRKRLVENASRIGKRWLNVVPHFQPLRLSNQEVATGLHDRTLVGSSLAICSFCGSDSPLGHDELCRSRNSWAQRRHDSINRIIHRGLQSVEGAVVSIEPRTLEGQRRNDLRVRGRCGLHATDYDLKVYCLNDRDARSTTSAKPAASSLTNHVLNRCLSWLDKVSENATRKAPATHSGLFKAVVLSTGGLVSRETADEMRRWRKEMGPMAFEGMMKKISLELVRARARTFAM